MKINEVRLRERPNITTEKKYIYNEAKYNKQYNPTYITENQFMQWHAQLP